MTRKVDYEGWALAMCSLLDEIERCAGDELIRPRDMPHRIEELCSMRFNLAEKHGLEVRFLVISEPVLDRKH